jgi:hypothetical protein
VWLGRSGGQRGWRGRKFWEVREVENFYRSDGSANLGGYWRRKILEVREVTKFGRSGGLDGRMDRQDALAGIKCIFATSCRLCVVIPVITAQKDLSTTFLFFMYKCILILCIEVVPRGMCQASGGFSLSKKLGYIIKTPIPKFSC